MKYRAAPTVVKKAALFGAPLASVLDGSADNMLDEASINNAMRRPGNVVSERVRVVRGSENASTKNGRPASASINAPWRDSDARDHPGLLTMAGSAIRRLAGLRLPNERTTKKIAARPASAISNCCAAVCWEKTRRSR